MSRFFLNVADRILPSLHNIEESSFFKEKQSKLKARTREREET
jgi:hypothetical protein